MAPERPLTGPTCPPPCNTPFRRRRYWARWDQARCPKCKRRCEVISTSLQPLQVMFGLPPASVSKVEG